MDKKDKKKLFLWGAIISFIFVALLIILVGDNPVSRFITGKGGLYSGTTKDTAATGTEERASKEENGGLFGVLKRESPSKEQGSATKESLLSGDGNKTKEHLFRQLTTVPVAGFSFIERGGRLFARYVAAETGFVYDVDPETGETIQITNTTFDKGVVEATLFAGGSRVIMRYADYLSGHETIKTHLGTINEKSAGMGDVRGIFLPDDILSISVSPDGRSLVYLRSDAGAVVVVLRSVSTGDERMIFQSPLKEWLLSFVSNEKIILTTKASNDIPGVAYLLDANTGEMSRLIRNKVGLTTLPSPSGTMTLYSEHTHSHTTTGLLLTKPRYFELEDPYTDEQFAFSTLAEKCSWSLSEEYLYCAIPSPVTDSSLPDLWYQGALELADRFWRIDTHSTNTTLLGDPELDQNRTLDAILPAISNDERFVVFVNKVDKFLWSLRVVDLTTPKEAGV